MRGGDAVNLFPLALFIESHNSQDGSQDHSGAMYPSHGFMKTDRTASFGSRYPGRADRIVSGHEIQISRHPAESRMQIAGGCARVLAAGIEGSGNGGNQRNGRDLTHPLMDL